MNDTPVAQWIAALRRLSLDHFRAKPRQKRGGEWTRNGLPKLENFHAGKWAGVRI